MPRVPTYDVGQVRIANLPSARLQNPISADTLDGGISRGLQQVGGQFAQIAQQEREKAAAAQLMDADRRLSEWEVQRLHAPETGLLNRRGKDALGLPDEALPELDKLASEIEGGLPEPVRLRFRQLANGRRSDVQTKLYRHVAEQSDVIFKAEQDAYQAQGLAAVATNYSDAERVAAESDRMWAAKLVGLTRAGASAEIIRAERAALEQSVTGTVLDQMLSRGEYTAAADYFKQNRDRLGDRADQYADNVRTGERFAKAASTADTLVSRFGAGSAAIAEAKKIEDVELRDDVMARIDREAVRRERAQNDYERGVAEQAWAKINSGAGMDALTPAEFGILSRSPGALSAMEQRSRQILEGVEPVRDDGRWYELLSMAAEKPDEFAKLDLNAERPRMDNGSWNQLVQTQAQVKSRGAAAAQESELLTGYRTTKQVVDDTLSGVGIDTSPKPGSSDAERLTAFRRALDERVLAFQQTTGKKPGTADVQAMADTLLIEGKIQGAGWFGTFGAGRLFEAAPDTVFVPDEVPAADRQKITDALRRSGVLNPTDQQIIDLYTAKIRATR